MGRQRGEPKNSVRSRSSSDEAEAFLVMKTKIPTMKTIAGDATDEDQDLHDLVDVPGEVPAVRSGDVTAVGASRQDGPLARAASP